MDKIKKVKIKRANGTISDYKPIGADAINIDLDNGDNLQDTIEKVARFYNNVEDMKKDVYLQNGDYVQTLGYYKANDGGGATYLIRKKTETDIEDFGSIHFINDISVAELIIENKVNIKQFGAKGNNINNDTIHIQNALNYANTNHIGKIIIPNGEFLIEQIKPYSFQTIEGESIDSKLKSISNNTKDSLLLIDKDNARHLILRDFFIEGDKNNNLNTAIHGILFKSKVGWGDVFGLLDNLTIHACSGDGIHATTETDTDNFYREMKFQNIKSYDNEGYGIYIEKCTDSTYIGCVCFSNLKSGYYFSGLGSNSRVLGCKAFWNGNSLNSIGEKYPGYEIIDASSSSFVGCEAQDNYGHGFHIQGGGRYSLIGFTADSNGNLGNNENGNKIKRSEVEELPYYAGVYLKNVDGIELQGNSLNRNVDSQGYMQKAGIKIEGSWCNLEGSITCYLNETEVENCFSDISKVKIKLNVNRKDYRIYCDLLNYVKDGFTILTNDDYYCYKVGDKIKLKCTIKQNEGVIDTTKDTAIMVLPVGFRTNTFKRFFGAISNNNGWDIKTVGVVNVGTGGAISIRGNNSISDGNCIVLDIDYIAND